MGILQKLRDLRTEVNCRIEHGAESGGHLEYVQSRLDSLLGQYGGPDSGVELSLASTCACESEGKIHFDRSLCACGSMHYYCEHGQVDACRWDGGPGA